MIHIEIKTNKQNKTKQVPCLPAEGTNRRGLWCALWLVHEGGASIVHGTVCDIKQTSGGDQGKDVVDVKIEADSTSDGAESHTAKDGTVDDLLNLTVSGAVGDGVHGDDSSKGTGGINILEDRDTRGYGCDNAKDGDRGGEGRDELDGGVVDGDVTGTS